MNGLREKGCKIWKTIIGIICVIAMLLEMSACSISSADLEDKGNIPDNKISVTSSVTMENREVSTLYSNYPNLFQEDGTPKSNSNIVFDFVDRMEEVSDETINVEKLTEYENARTGETGVLCKQYNTIYELEIEGMPYDNPLFDIETMTFTDGSSETFFEMNIVFRRKITTLTSGPRQEYIEYMAALIVFLDPGFGTYADAYDFTTSFVEKNKESYKINNKTYNIDEKGNITVDGIEYRFIKHDVGGDLDEWFLSVKIRNDEFVKAS